MFEISIDFDKDVGSEVLKMLKGELKTLEKLEDQRSQVGIFESTSSRSDGKSNAEIGYAHEYGIGEPRRSFLEVPSDEFQISVLDKLKTSDIQIDEKFISKLGSMFLEKVKDEILTNGHGTWLPLSKKTKRKVNQNRRELLRDTMQLYESIEMRVIKE